MKFGIVTPWHNKIQRDSFLEAWGATGDEPYLFLQQDKDKSGCALTKNRGIRRAIDAGAEIILVLDDDCFPEPSEAYNNYTRKLEFFAEDHIAALNPIPVRMFEEVTSPPSRGTPYFNRSIEMPVAASMGFWTHIGDYDAPGQLVHGAKYPMDFKREPIHGRYFPLCGMNLAFRAEWWPWCQFINVPRFDDIWQGLLFEKRAYATGHCFNLGAPLVRHSRQSNVFSNLRDEAPNMENNETLWQKIYSSKSTEYDDLVKLLPI